MTTLNLQTATQLPLQQVAAAAADWCLDNVRFVTEACDDRRPDMSV